jgi:hypothetical protein
MFEIWMLAAGKAFNYVHHSLYKEPAYTDSQ